MVELVDTRDLKSLAQIMSVLVRVQLAAPSWKTRAILQNPPPARGSQPQRTALHSPRQNFRNLVIRVLNSAYESRTVRSQVYGR